MSISDTEFEQLIADAMDRLPEKYMSALDNVAVVYADEPTPAQREKLRLRGNQTLYGLYEGIPQPERGSGYSLVLPDKITLFKYPLVSGANTPEELKAEVLHTLWHEIAHHFGLDHDRIHALEQK